MDVDGAGGRGGGGARGEAKVGRLFYRLTYGWVWTDRGVLCCVSRPCDEEQSTMGISLIGPPYTLEGPR